MDAQVHQKPLLSSCLARLIGCEMWLTLILDKLRGISPQGWTATIRLSQKAAMFYLFLINCRIYKAPRNM